VAVISRTRRDSPRSEADGDTLWSPEELVGSRRQRNALRRNGDPRRPAPTAYGQRIEPLEARQVDALGDRAGTGLSPAVEVDRLGVVSSCLPELSNRPYMLGRRLEHFLADVVRESPGHGLSLHEAAFLASAGRDRGIRFSDRTEPPRSRPVRSAVWPRSARRSPACRRGRSRPAGAE